MERDMELVRSILKKMAEHEDGFAPTPFRIDGYSDDVVGHHVWLMEQAGLITANDVTSQGDPAPVALPGTVTWEGHDFLNAVRNDTVWAKTKASLKAQGMTVVSIPFALLKAYALKQAADYLGLQLPP